MSELIHLLVTHWLALVMLATALVCGLLAALRRKHVTLLVTTAIGCGAFALGSMFLHGWTFALAPGGDKRSIAGAVMLASLLGLYGMVVLVLAARVWNGYLAAILGIVAVLGFGGLVGRPVT